MDRRKEQIIRIHESFRSYKTVDSFHTQNSTELSKPRKLEEKIKKDVLAKAKTNLRDSF